MEVAIGWAVAPLIKLVVEKAKSYVSGQYKLQSNLKKNLEKLENTLMEILVIVAELERGSINNQHQIDWLRGIKDSIYEAEDLLDEFEYRMIEGNVQERYSGKDIVSHLAFSSSSFAKRVIPLDGFPKRLGKILEKLDRMNSSANRFHHIMAKQYSSANQQLEKNSWSLTSSIMVEKESEIFGRETEKEELVGLLLDTIDLQESGDTNTSAIIAVIGDGGVGKTTLAQLVYNDNRVIDHFDLRMWICVSDNFDLIKLTKLMLDSASKRSKKYEDSSNQISEREEFVQPMPQPRNFDNLQDELLIKIQSKRFLLVLDDVWIDEGRSIWQNKDGWEKLFAPLKGGASGSKILLTSRMIMVARVLGATHSISLCGLSDHVNWLLLKHRVFGNEYPTNFSELQAVGVQIVKKLNGSPLAAKVVGAMLNDKIDVEYWKEISEKNIFSSIIPILRLSYQRLPEHLKPCFAYCSIFPKNWIFDIDNLVHLWMAQGYLQSQKNDVMETINIGKQYFHDLLDRSFFQILNDGPSTSYVMHHSMHDLAQSISQNECYRIEQWKEPKDIPFVRHLGIYINDSVKLCSILAQLKQSNKLNDLRTLVIFLTIWWEMPPQAKDLLEKLKSLRVLALCGRIVTKHLPDCFSHLLHLRYLQLENYQSSCFPETLSRLYHLEALLISGDWLVLSPRLHHLNKLILLQGKVQFHFPKGLQRQCKGFISWSEKKWFINLGNIMLRDCREWKSLPPFGHLPFLKELVIKEMPHVERISVEFYATVTNEGLKGFQSLEVLEITNMPKLSEWSVIKYERLFPCLFYLVIKNCPKLKRLPFLESPLPPMLRHMEIRHVGPFSRVLQLPSYGIEDSIANSLILSCSIIPSKTPLRLHFDHLTVIKRLTITNCHEAMPTQGLHGLVSLKILTMQDCSKLLSWRTPEGDEENEDQANGFLPTSLESFSIHRCILADECLSRCLEGLASLFFLEIEDCTILASLPSSQVLRGLKELHWLGLYSCEELTSLGGLHKLPLLKTLEVEWCGKLRFLPNKGLPPSVETLALRRCHPDLMQHLQERTGPEWNKISCIPSVKIGI